MLFRKKRLSSIQSYQRCSFFLSALLILNFSYSVAFAQKNPKALKSNAEFVDAVKHYRYLNPDSALLFVKTGLAKAVKENDELGEAALLNQYGMIEDNVARYQEARQKYLKAEAIYRKQNNEPGIASTLVRLGVVEKRKGNYAKSIPFFLDALKLSEKNHDKLGILESRVVLAETYLDLKDLENSETNLKIAEKLDSQMPLSNFSLNMYIAYGSFYTEKKQYEKAIEYLKIGLSKINKVEYNGSRIGLLKSLGIAYFKKGDFNLAVSSLKQALASARKIDNVLREQNILIDLASFYEQTNPDTSLRYLNDALKIVDNHQMYQQEIMVLNNMSEVYKRKGNFEQALSLKEKSYKLSEDVFYKGMTEQISNLENAYELEKSNSLIRELKVKTSKEAVVYNIILGIAIAITLFLIITLIYFFRARHLNKLLSSANVRLEESNVEKDKFFSIVAHDIRSPLASTISVLKFIANRELDDQTQDEVVGKLALHCESSLEILDKLLKWGQMQIKGVRINVAQFKSIDNINANVAVLREAAESKDIRIEIDVNPNLVIKADSDHFDFVVRNLLANAIKFTPIKGTVKLVATSGAEGLITFKISDNGVGIGQNRIKKIFQLSAIGTKGTSHEEGTSLGLLICKEFIEANNGTVTVESELDKGTTFIFSLPGYIAEAK